MSPSQTFIVRPVATTLLMAAILLSGAFAFTGLPLSALPEVDYPTIQVQTFYPGASPEVMTSAVTAPLEVQLGQMPGLNQMVSASSAGASVITLQFSLDLSLDVAEQEVQAAINAAQSLLPANLPAPPIYAKVNPADAPVLTLAVTSKTEPLTNLEDLGRNPARAENIATARRWTCHNRRRTPACCADSAQSVGAGSLRPQHRRRAHHHRRMRTSICPRERSTGREQSSTINANDQLTSAEAYASVILAYRNNGPVRLSDVANIISGAENTKLGAWVNRTPGIILSIQRQPGANVIQVADSIKALLPSLREGLPQGINVDIVSDRTGTIRASVADVEFELGLAVVLVVIVIFVFLRNLPATLIPSLSVPLSLIGTFGVMYLLGYSLDNLSLMALTISTGFVVDDAIVMIENIARYTEGGESPLDAALKGSEQIGFTIISLTISLIAVLIPLLFMGGVVGRLFHEFAVTLAVTIVISAIVALTLVPMMSARLIRHRTPAEQSRFERISERSLNWIIARYGQALRWVLDRQPLTLLVAIATLGLTIYLYVIIPKGFFPGAGHRHDPRDYRGLARHLLRCHGAGARQLADAVLKDPDVESLTSFVGVDGTNLTLNSGRLLINLKPHDSRQSTASEIIRRLQTEVAGIAGIALYMQPVQDLTIETSVNRAEYSSSSKIRSRPNSKPGCRSSCNGSLKRQNSAALPTTWRRTGWPWTSLSTGKPRPVSVSHRQPSTTLSTMPSASGSFPPFTRNPINTGSSWKSRHPCSRR